MIVQCPDCPAKFNKDTVTECPLCKYKKVPRQPKTITKDQDIENQVKGVFAAARRGTKGS